MPLTKDGNTTPSEIPRVKSDSDGATKAVLEIYLYICIPVPTSLPDMMYNTCSLRYGASPLYLFHLWNVLHVLQHDDMVFLAETFGTAFTVCDGFDGSYSRTVPEGYFLPQRLPL